MAIDHLVPAPGGGINGDSPSGASIRTTLRKSPNISDDRQPDTDNGLLVEKIIASQYLSFQVGSTFTKLFPTGKVCWKWGLEDMN